MKMKYGLSFFCVLEKFLVRCILSPSIFPLEKKREEEREYPRLKPLENCGLRKK